MAAVDLRPAHIGPRLAACELLLVRIEHHDAQPDPPKIASAASTSAIFVVVDLGEGDGLDTVRAAVGVEVLQTGLHVHALVGATARAVGLGGPGRIELRVRVW